ncbi:hypothetical protein BASA81_018210 [Batrachochytrium salamandrivorans]|nr:hypothetical protein BASA81_018210 [Batrachochytrium salamandrivorans]
MWLRIGLVVLPTVYTIYSLIKWRIVVNRQMKLLKAYHPDMPAVAYLLSPHPVYVMDVTRTGIIPDWLMPLPGTWLWTGKYNTFAQLGCDTISVVGPDSRQSGRCGLYMICSVVGQTGIHGATANTERGFHINVSEDMVKLALYVISGAGFGMRLDWDTSNTDTISGNMVISCR